MGGPHQGLTGVAGRKLVLASALLAVIGVAATGSGAEMGGTAPLPKEKSAQEIEALISKAGTTLPDWWVKDFSPPPTLDLTWIKVSGWKPNENIGTYMFIVAPRPEKWKEAIQVADKSLAALYVDQTDEEDQCMRLMGDFYCRLGDWARAAYWWRKAGVMGSGDQPYGLASCYWQLGAPKLAMEMLSALQADNQRGKAVRLLAELGQTDKALALAAASTQVRWADWVSLAEGDVHRRNGNYDEAERCYQKLLDMGEAKELQYNQKRARQNQTGVRLFKDVKLAEMPDGAHTGSGVGYRGPLQVEVIVKAGRIESVKVTEEKDDREFDSLTVIPRRIVEKQGMAGVDAVTGATLSSEAVINAVADALGNKNVKK
jgi:uncharacterized protein with FMN-binding domain